MTAAGATTGTRVTFPDVGGGDAEATAAHWEHVDHKCRRMFTDISGVPMPPGVMISVRVNHRYDKCGCGCHSAQRDELLRKINRGK